MPRPASSGRNCPCRADLPEATGMLFSVSVSVGLCAMFLAEAAAIWP